MYLGKKIYLLFLVCFINCKLLSMYYQTEGTQEQDLSAFGYSSLKDFDDKFLAQFNNEVDLKVLNKIFESISKIYDQDFNISEWIGNNCVPQIIDKNFSYAQKIEFNGSGNKVIYCIGDTHADYLALKKIIQDIIKDDLKLKPEETIIFLGDFTDRGFENLKTIALIFLLKIINPNNVYILKGNHETYPYKTEGNISAELKALFIKQQIREDLLNNIFDKFNLLPTILYVSYYSFIARFNHGGCGGEFDPKFLLDAEYFSVLQDISQLNLEGLLWGDISANAKYPSEPSPRGGDVKLHSIKYSFEEMKKQNVNLWARGHQHSQPADEWAMAEKLKYKKKFSDGILDWIDYCNVVNDVEQSVCDGAWIFKNEDKSMDIATVISSGDKYYPTYLKIRLAEDWFYPEIISCK